jgi:hypothetical protein
MPIVLTAQGDLPGGLVGQEPIGTFGSRTNSTDISIK